MAALAPAFADAVTSSQAVFHTVMNALARPGTVFSLSVDLQPPAPLSYGAAAIALAMLDYETPFWLDPRLAATPAVAQWLKFHTGAPLTEDSARAAFALISDSATMPVFESFCTGTAEYPDRSATLIVEVEAFGAAAPFKLSGPGIQGTRMFSVTPVPTDFPSRLRANRALFPCGIDLIFVAGDRIAALPRSTRIVMED